MIRLVADTNIVISAFFWKGPPQEVYTLCRRGEAKLLFSTAIESELVRVLAYPRFGLRPAEILPLINDIRAHGELAPVKAKLLVIGKDPTDNIFIECAVDGKADMIVSGDHHLLDIRNFRGIEVVSAKTAIDAIRKNMK
ncbi:MAG: putative toxin-antitoxin system toxin component, PIN family [Candidatus Edwardsbacteria bacterium]|nr:putative toxin-antitoxin system toxin component, PIN family [Candidatus Edwardsbacteria bacterium]